MFKYTKLGVNVFSFVISFLIFILIDLFVFNQNFAFQANLNSIKIQENTNNVTIKEEVKEDASSKNNTTVNLTKSNILEEKKEQEKTEQQKKENTTKEANWKIEIPSISLNAEIKEGTENKVIDNYVGHFESTSKTTGNIGLAAHNRGYPKNYFENLKKLKEGDEIKYKCGNFEKTYIVKYHKIIKDTDWSILEKTEENTLTLITCVENEPNYRRCVQAVEKSKK